MTASEIIKRAMTLVEAEVGGITDEAWKEDMFYAWYEEGMNNLLLKINNELLDLFYKTSTTITTANGGTLDTDWNKLVEVKRAGNICFITDSLKSNSNSLYEGTTAFPTAYIEGKQLKISPSGADAVTVKYIRTLSFDSSTQLNTESEIPSNWQGLLIDYITGRALEKDKKVDVAAIYMTKFNEQIAVINQKG